jgi:glycosyltransferase involved in cell wall biosynthesis
MPAPKKSICMIVQNYYEIDIRVRRKAEALVNAGYAVDVLALRSPTSKHKRELINGVVVHTLSLGKKRGSKGRYYFEYIAFFLWSIWKLAVLMGHTFYAVVEVNTLPDFLVFAAMGARWTGSKVLLDMHEITPEFFMSKYGVSADHWQVRLARFIEKASVSFAHHVLTINEPIQRLLMGRGLPASKSTIVMNSADESMFESGGPPPASSLGTIPSDPFILMYHGTLTRLYGLDIALRGFSLVGREAKDAALWILGDGPEKRSLENLARELGLDARVRFIGMVLPDEVRHWLERCSVGILPTRRDVFLEFSFSNKLSEYIIMRKPVIVSRLKTIRHYFSDEALAFFEPESPEDLARQIIRLYGNPDLRDRLSRRASEEYRPIRWEVMKRRYLDIVGHLARRTSDSGLHE